MTTETDLNVLGEPLDPCSLSPMTGYLRDGACRMPTGDGGRHGVCAWVTEAFLAFTRERGNDLSTAIPRFGFPGLRPGDRWCLCVDRWAEAEAAGVAPPVVLSATHQGVLKRVSLERLAHNALSEGAGG